MEMPIQRIAADQNAYLNNLSSAMGDEVEDTIQRENDSRVAQLREMRRMEHEKGLEKMRQDTERMKLDAMIKRLNSNVVRFPGGSVHLG